ncbi:MAG TPA: hypothetical protein VFU28_19260 [Vicinamibacterales bacterium]|nr:hypothetical protein [Vicinamibacterales bacterium]
MGQLVVPGVALSLPAAAPPAVLFAVAALGAAVSGAATPDEFHGHTRKPSRVTARFRRSV